MERVQRSNRLGADWSPWGMVSLRASAVQQVRHPAATVARAALARGSPCCWARARLPFLPQWPHFTRAYWPHLRVAGKGADWSAEWVSCPAGYWEPQNVSYGEELHMMSPTQRDSSANLFLDSCATNIPTKPLVTHELVYSPPSGHLSIQSGQLLYPTPAPNCNVSAVHILLVPSNCKGPSVNLIQTCSSSVICQSQKDKTGVLQE